MGDTVNLQKLTN